MYWVLFRKMSSDDETQNLQLPCSSDDNVRLNMTWDNSPNATHVSNVVPSPPVGPYTFSQDVAATGEPEKPADISVQPKFQSHPPMIQMVAEALKAKEDKHGTSVAAIKFYIRRKYPAVDMKRLRYLLKQALAKGISDGMLVRPRNSTVTGARGRFKLVSKNKTKVTQTKKSTAAVKPRKKKAARTSEARKVSSEPSTKRKVPASKKKVPTEASTKRKAPATKKTVPTEASTKRKVPASKKKVPTEALPMRKAPATKKKVPVEASTKRKIPATKKTVPTEASTKRKVPSEASTKRKAPATVKKVPVKASTKKKPPEEAKKVTKVGMSKEVSKPKGARDKKDEYKLHECRKHLS
uniref:Histone H1.8 n=1 Tax=Phascolarctos cinereus TaxID=38626 RepID=A0A6P5JY74_PHACI|nr:protein B4 [Phascolarctos cinereus]